MISTGEVTVETNDVLGKIDFSAPEEGDENDAIFVGASISAVAGADFTATVNDTDLVFSVGKSEVAAEKMRLNSDGNLNVDGTLTCDTSLTIDNTTISAAEIGVLDSVTAGAVTANKALVVEGSGHIGTADARLGTITSSGKFVTNNNTNASTTTDGSIATAGGLSVAQDVVIGQGLKLKSDANAVMSFGADSEITLSCVTDTGLNLKNTNTTNAGGVVLTLQTGDTDIALNDVLGSIEFQAPDEGTGTAAAEVAAAISAVSEGDFAADSNATKLSFKTGASEAATEKMALSSAGVLTLSSGGIVIPDAGTIGSDTDNDAIAISAAGVVTLSSTTASTDKDSGALVVTGGVGIKKSLNVLGVDVDGNPTTNLFGTTSAGVNIDLDNQRLDLNNQSFRIRTAATERFSVDTSGNVSAKRIQTTGDDRLGNSSGDILTIESSLVINSGSVSCSASAEDTAGKALSISAGDTTAGDTNDIAGGSLTFKAGAGKGTGAGGSIIFQTANAAGGSANTLNSHATALTIEDDLSATFAGDVQTGGKVTFNGFRAVTGNYTIDGSGNDHIISVSGGDLDITLVDAANGREIIIINDQDQSIEILTNATAKLYTSGGATINNTNLGGTVKTTLAARRIMRLVGSGINWYMVAGS